MSEITPQPMLKKPEIKRDLEGRFERHGKALSKTAKKTKHPALGMLNEPNSEKSDLIKKNEDIKEKKPSNRGGWRAGAGRPKGSLNKITVGLKEAILAAGEAVGNDMNGGGLTTYLKTLAVENSSAYAGLLGKVLPSTLAMPETNGGVTEKVTFERVIVWPDGHREIEGVTPKQIAPPETVTKTDIDEPSE